MFIILVIYGVHLPPTSLCVSSLPLVFIKLARIWNDGCAEVPLP